MKETFKGQGPQWVIVWKTQKAQHGILKEMKTLAYWTHFFQCRAEAKHACMLVQRSGVPVGGAVGHSCERGRRGSKPNEM